MEFVVVRSAKGDVAGCVSGPGGVAVKGSSRGERKNKGARRYTKRCYNCDEYGHKVNECKKPRKTERICHHCGSVEHLIRKCPVLLRLLTKLNGVQSEELP